MIDISYAEPSEEAKEIARKYGYQPYMVERYLKMWGRRETIEYLEATLRGIRKVIRVNTLKIGTKKLKHMLEDKGYILSRVPWAKFAFWLDKEPFPAGATFEYMMGYYYVHRGGGSLAPPLALEPEPGDLIVDMCAAPGGKTTYMAELTSDHAVILAVDLSRMRMRALRSHVSRLGITSVVAVRWDARKILELKIRPDKILLDAPCSGEGLTPIDVERRRRRTMQDLLDMMKMQLELLRAAVDSVRPGGIVVYSTCSIAPEENEFVIDRLLEEHGEKVDVEDIRLNVGVEGFTRVFGNTLDGRLRRCIRLYPHKHGTEGYFVCRLRRR